MARSRRERKRAQKRAAENYAKKQAEKAKQRQLAIRKRNEDAAAAKAARVAAGGPAVEVVGRGDTWRGNAVAGPTNPKKPITQKVATTSKPNDEYGYYGNEGKFYYYEGYGPGGKIKN